MSRRINVAAVTTQLMTIALALVASSSTAFAQNMDCTLIVPQSPLSEAGLATPYRLKATTVANGGNPANGPCNEEDFNSSAFVQGVIINKDTGEVTIYNPLVVTDGVGAAIQPTRPDLPDNRVVAIWFGFNGNNLFLESADEAEDLVADHHCVQHLGQNAHCNAVAFFEEAHDQIAMGNLIVPPLGTGLDGLPCPTTRSFSIADQDQSDNVATQYIFVTAGPNAGKTAQNTAANRAALGVHTPPLPTDPAAVKGNPSDERLLEHFIDPALGCTPWQQPNIADAGALASALPLNELMAEFRQTSPIALVPLGDPFTFEPPITGTPNLAQVNRYRAMVDQRAAATDAEASTTTYCTHQNAIARQKIALDRPFLENKPPAVATLATNLFTFMCGRYVGTYQILGCEALIHQPVNVDITMDAQGRTNSCVIH
jgi:hypothetical protein